MSNIWFISDTHFCHEKNFIWEKRGYKSVHQMNKDLIEKWNKTVEPEDIVYHLGDVMLNDNEEGMKILKNLKGQIHIIAGNHDTEKRIELYRESWNVVDVKYADLIKYNKHRSFYLSHYPAIVANYDDDKKLWNISGHDHTENRFKNMAFQVYNVCIEAHDGFPVNIDEVLEDIRRLRNDI